MIIWSIHPKYLDSNLLVLQWRDGLLCQSALQEKTRGYKKHPQVLRIKKYHEPLQFINKFLESIWNEGEKRKFKFEHFKINFDINNEIFYPLEVSNELVQHEFDLLQLKYNEFNSQYLLNEQYINEDGLEINTSFIEVYRNLSKIERKIYEIQ